MIYNLMSNLCDYVQTSSGDTWQKLVNYETNGCTAGYVDLTAYGSKLTEENCNDVNFVPVGYTEVLTGDSVILCEVEDETTNVRVSFVLIAFIVCIPILDYISCSNSKIIIPKLALCVHILL